MMSMHHHSYMASDPRRAFVIDGALTILIVAVAILVSGWMMWNHYSAERESGHPGDLPRAPVVSDGLAGEEVLQRLLSAIRRHDYPSVEAFARALFADRADTNLDPAIDGLRDPVIRAAYDGDVRLFDALAAARPVFGGRDGQNRRPLHIAAAEGHSEAVRWLLVHEVAEPDDKVVGTGLTALHLAAERGHLVCIDVLLELGASLESTSERGRTVIHHAAANGNVAGLMRVLDHVRRNGSDAILTRIDTDGKTALRIAEESGHAEIVHRLVKAGAK